jgi:peroxiredoxin
VLYLPRLDELKGNKVMNRILRPVILIPALAGLICSFLVFHTIWQKRKLDRPSIDSAGVGLPLPKGRIVNLRTNQDDFEKISRGKVLLVFLTRGCDACRKEIPNISKALPSLTPRISVYGVYVEDRGDVESFIQENQITFPVLLDVGGRIFASLHITLIPAKVLLEDGTITKIWFGSSPNESTLIRDVMEVRK